MMSPAYASLDDLSALCHQLLGLGQTDLLPALDMVHFHSSLKLSEQIRMNAILSLWALFMLAWILNTKAENFFIKRIHLAIQSLSGKRGGGHI